MTTSADVVPLLQAAGVGGDAQHALARRVVDEQLRLAEDAAGLDELRHVVGAEMALAQLVAVHAGLAAEQALGQLDARLFQADEEDRQPSSTTMWRAMLRANAVLPTLGRAARMISSEFCKPAVILSRSTIAGRRCR